MKKIYLDNGSTSFPKAPGVGKAMQVFIDEVGCNVGRGGYENSYSLAEQILGAREKLCSLFHFHKESSVIFTPSITYSLNFLLGGLLKPGDHVITTAMEHNAVARPLEAASKRGVPVSFVPCDGWGQLDPADVEKAILPTTRAVVMLHASNVCGSIMPLAEVGAICREHELFFLVDSAQTAGVFPVNVEEMNIDCLAFTGHKGLLGPQGIGGFLITDKLATTIDPIIFGGTGSLSDTLDMPDFLPDKFEAGTLNLPGILGLSKAIEYLEEVGIDTIRERELYLAARFLDPLRENKDISVIGRQDMQNRSAIVSLDFPHRDNAEVSWLLDQKYGIMTRCGLHCAPLAHRTLGTFPRGTVRFAFGHKNTEEEVDIAVKAIQSILQTSS